MQKVYLVYVWEAEICDSVLYAICGNEKAVNDAKAELLKNGYRAKDICVDEHSVRF